MFKNTFAVTLSFILVFPCFAQLSKPSIEAPNVGWGWFNLRMSDNSVKPVATDWYLFDPAKNQVVLKTQCDPSMCNELCRGEYDGDSYDIREKLVIGNTPGQNYIAKVRYSDGNRWSDWSEPINVQVPPEDLITGNELNIIVWGDEFVIGPDYCGVESSVRVQGSKSDMDHFCHALENDLRRITNKNIRVINEGLAGRKLSDWKQIMEQKYNSIYADEERYPVALFFYGANDIQSSQTANEYARNLNDLIYFMTQEKKRRSMISSASYSTREELMPYDKQFSFRSQWNLVMALNLQNNNLLYKGIDLYQIMKNDSLRYLSGDGYHLDLTEGSVEIVHILSPKLEEMINLITKTDGPISSEQKISLWWNKNDDELVFDKQNLQLDRAFLSLYDLTAKKRISQPIEWSKNSMSTVKINTLVPGIYSVILTDSAQKIILSQKIWIE